MNDFVELRRIVNVVLRRWWLVLLLTMLTAVAGYVISQQLKPIYQATTSVIVGQSIQATNLDSRDIQTSERLALSYADIARRQPILQAVNVALNLDYTWQNLRNRVKVKLVPDTQLLEITVEADSREEAVLIADEIAQQLILLSPASLQNQEDETVSPFVKQRLQDLQIKIETNQETLNALTQAHNSASTIEQKAVIQTDIDDLESRLAEWENTYTKFLTFVGNEKSANYIAVVENAHAKRSPIRPSIRLNTAVAGTVGFVLALGVIFLLEFLDDTLKTVDDIVRELNLTPLGTIGKHSGRDGVYKSQDTQESVFVAQNPFSPVSESYRMIRSNLQFMLVDNPGRSILVTSPGPGEGKSTTVANLGIVMANNGQKTIIVDADLRRSVLHKSFHASNGIGLTTQFRVTKPTIRESLLETKVDNLWLLPAGQSPPNPSELLGSQQMDPLLDSLMAEADVVIFDTPPAALVADAAVLSKRVDGVLLVVSAGETKREAAKQAVFNLQQSGAKILGVVLNRAPDTNSNYRYAAVDQQPRFRVAHTLAGLRSMLTLAGSRSFLKMRESSFWARIAEPFTGKGKLRLGRYYFIIALILSLWILTTAATATIGQSSQETISVIPETQPTLTIIETPTANNILETPTNASIAVSSLATGENSAGILTSTPINLPTETATNIPTETPTNTPPITPTNTPVATVSNKIATGIPSESISDMPRERTTSTSVPTATPTDLTGIVGRILYVSGDLLYTTDPNWSSPIELGLVSNDTCGSLASTAAGASYALYQGLYCEVGGAGAGECRSPNGLYSVVTEANDATTTSVSVKDQSSDVLRFVYDGPIDRSAGIRWAPTSNAFLFMVGDTVYSASAINEGYSQILTNAFNPTFSPDGSLILYRKPSSPGVIDIFVSNSDGSSLRNISNVSSVDKFCPAWRQ